MTRTYKRYATCENPGPKDWKVIEIREDGRQREILPEHHGYKDLVASRKMAYIENIPFTPKKDSFVALDRDAARAQATKELLPEYLSILARWEAFSETTKTEALAPWVQKVKDRALVLAGESDLVEIT